MILSVSRRTDIPAFYSNWFFNRIKEGYLYVRNPMNPKQISKIILSSNEIEFIVFWTKNPLPMLERIEEINNYNYYFQFTLNSYDQKIEPGVPPKLEVIKTFISLAKRIGKAKIIWRYDPIFFTDKIDINYHKKYFKMLAERLNGYTNRCTISFINMYKKTKKNTKHENVRELSDLEKIELSSYISEIGKKNNISIETCAENIDLTNIGIKNGKCIDDNLIRKILGKHIITEKDRNQRDECRCIKSVDVGAYNSCKHKCIYCYANYSYDVVDRNSKIHNPNSALLFGELSGNEKITLRKEKNVVKPEVAIF